MGLDMWAYSTRAEVSADVDFKIAPEDSVEIHYWRKHPDLHGWMERLYRSKGGQSNDFNCVNLRLTADDLDRLEEDIQGGKLPSISGFFFGGSNGEEVDDDLEFVAKARDALADGTTIYYTSWW